MNFFSGPFWSRKNRHKDFYEGLLVFTLKVNISDGEVYHTKQMSTSPLTILYVDDEPLLLQATKAYLEHLGFHVETTDSGLKALGLLSEKHYDAIVSDYQMAGMDGITLLKEIRSRNPDIPFILYTGRGREEVVIEAIDNGADFYVQKGGKPAPQFKELTHKIRIAVQKKQDRKALMESELRFRSLIQNSSDIIRILDKDGTILFDSPSSSRILGYPEGSLVGTCAFDYIHPEDKDQVESDFLEVHNNTNDHIPTEYRIRKADGSYLYVESVGLNLLDTPGINGIVTTTHPIHTQKMAEFGMKKVADDLAAAYEELAANEEELRISYEQLKEQELALLESEERFRSMAERSSDLIILISKEFLSIYLSPSAHSVIGYDPEEFVGKPAEYWAQTIFSPSGPEFYQAVQKTMNGESVSNLEVQIQKKNGEYAYVNINAVPTQHEEKITGIQVSMRDITPVRKAERAFRESEIKLRKSEQRFLATTTNAGFWVWEVDADGIYTYSSPAVESIMGYRPDDLIGKIRFFDLFDPSVRDEQVEMAREIFDSKKSFSNFINLNSHKNGRCVILNTCGTPVFDEHGTFSGYCGVDQDITTQKEAEEKIRDSEARYRLLADNVHDVIWTTDERMRITYVSPSVTDMLGFSPAEIRTMTFRDLLTPESYQRIINHHYEWLDQLLENKKITDKSTVELEFIRKDQTRVCTEIMIKPIYTEYELFIGLVGVTRDISKRKHTEKALKVANHQLSLLTSVTRHDILNKVSVIFTYLSLADLEYASPKLTEYLRIIKMATDDIQSHIEFTRVYQNLGSQEPQWFILERVMPRSVLPVNIHYLNDLCRFALYGDPMLEKVFFNLLDNSIRHGDYVTDIRVSAYNSDGGLIIIWEDNGRGIPYEEKDSIFEHGVGNNTGFGLFLVREILLLTGITIQETGIPGNGARFEIRVPKGVYRIIEG